MSFYSPYRWCVALNCKNSTLKTPEKLFINVPTDVSMRNVWLELAGRDPVKYSKKSHLYLCEDHFDAVGCGGVSFAVWALYDGRAVESAAGRAALCALAAWGGALAAGALAALAGAVRGSASLLAAAFALLALSAVAEGAAVWWGAAHVPALRAALRDTLTRSVLHEYGAVESRTQVIDAIQHGLQCCGAAGPRDWQRAAWAGGAEGAGGAGGALDLSVSAPAAHYWVPASCCAAAGAECAAARRLGAGAGGGAGLHVAGCAERVVAALGAAARAPLLAGAALLAAHAAALLLALALCLRVRPHRKV